MQLRPREIFTIARGLEDHTDSSTYYVRAVIRNARTYAIIETVDLESQAGGHTFLYDWQVPADSSGEGFYILITTSVYTDAGYTTKSDLYGDKLTEYLIADRLNPNSGGIGGGADIDYKKIQKIIKEAVDRIEKPQKWDIAPIMLAIDSLASREHHCEKPKDIDLTPFLESLETSRKETVTLKQIKEIIPETVSLSTITEHFSENNQKIEELKNLLVMEVTKIKDFYEKMNLDSSQISQAMQDMFDKVKILCLDDVTDIRKSINSIKTYISDVKTIVSDLEEKIEATSYVLSENHSN